MTCCQGYIYWKTLLLLIIVVVFSYCLDLSLHVKDNIVQSVDPILQSKIKHVSLDYNVKRYDKPNMIITNIPIQFSDDIDPLVRIDYFNFIIKNDNKEIINAIINNFTVARGIQQLTISLLVINNTIHYNDISFDFDLQLNYLPSYLIVPMISQRNIRFDNNQESNLTIEYNGIPEIDYSLNKIDFEWITNKIYANIAFKNQSFIVLPEKTMMELYIGNVKAFYFVTTNSSEISLEVYVDAFKEILISDELYIHIMWTPFINQRLSLFIDDIPDFNRINSSIPRCNVNNIFMIDDIVIEKRGVHIEYQLDISKQDCFDIVDTSTIYISDVTISLMHNNIDFFDVKIATDAIFVNITNSEIMGDYLTSLFDDLVITIHYGDIIFPFRFELPSISSSISSQSSINIFDYILFLGLDVQQDKIDLMVLFDIDYIKTSGIITLMSIQDIFSFQLKSSNNKLQLNIHIYTTNATSWQFLTEKSVYQFDLSILGADNIILSLPEEYTPLIFTLPSLTTTSSSKSQSNNNNDVIIPRCKGGIYSIIPGFKLNDISIEQSSLMIESTIMTSDPTCEVETPILLGLRMINGYTIKFLDANRQLFASLYLKSVEMHNKSTIWPSSTFDYYDLTIKMTIEDSLVFSQHILQNIFTNNQTSIVIAIEDIMNYTIVIEEGVGEDLLTLLFTSFFVSNDYIQRDVPNGISIQYSIDINLPDFVFSIIPPLNIGPYAWEISHIVLFSFSVERTLNIKMKLDILYDDIYEKNMFFDRFTKLLTSNKQEIIPIRSLPSNIDFNMMFPRSPEIVYCYFDEYIQTPLANCQKGKMICINKFPFPVRIHVLSSCDTNSIYQIDMYPNQIRKMDNLYSIYCNEKVMSYRNYDDVYICNTFNVTIGGVNNIKMHLYQEKPIPTDSNNIVVFNPTNSPTFTETSIPKEYEKLDKEYVSSLLTSKGQVYINLSIGLSAVIVVLSSIGLLFIIVLHRNDIIKTIKSFFKKTKDS